MEVNLFRHLLINKVDGLSAIKLDLHVLVHIGPETNQKWTTIRRSPRVSGYI